MTLTRDALPSAAASLETSIGGNSQLLQCVTMCTMCYNVIQCVHCAGTFPAIPDQDLQLKEMVAANLNRVDRDRQAARLIVISNKKRDGDTV